MSRRDPGAASGGPIREPRRCDCGRPETLHPIRTGGGRGAFRAAGCTGFQPTNVVGFPRAGTTPAPAGPRPAPADLDAMGERYVAYAEARDSGQTATAALLAAAVADDVPAWRDEVHRVELLRRELAAELDRVTGHA